ncbi:MAG: hypothetical protein EA383_05150 [Spirochaetaceae bacterium]|nr:MAG: hypothetical protein EA383_05150 [Spirochaetaceae bacterium]
MNRRVVLATGLLLCVSFSLFADLSIRSDRWQSVFAEGQERTRLTGNARVSSDRIVVEADEIELSGDSFRFVRASGNLLVIDLERDLRLTGNRLFVDRDLDIIRVEGNAEMEDRENEMIVRGGFIEYFGEQELTIIQVGVRILRADLLARAEFARYLRETSTLELSGLPQVSRNGDEFRAGRIIINLDSDEITLRGEVRAIVRDGED